MATRVTEYQGLVVSVSDWGSFSAQPDEETELHSDTLTGLKEEIDSYLKSQVAAGREGMALPVILENGSTATVHGIHAGTSALLGLPARTHSPCLPDTPGLRLQVQKVIDLRHELQQATDALEPYRIRPRISYKRLTPTEIVTATQGLREDYDSKRKAADEAFA